MGLDGRCNGFSPFVFVLRCVLLNSPVFHILLDASPPALLWSSHRSSAWDLHPHRPPELWRYPLPFSSHGISTGISKSTPSCHLTPAIYLNILLPVVPIISRNPTVKGHVSEPYNRTGLMHASYNLARCLKGTSRLTKRLDISFHFSQDAEILPLTATSTPPSHSSSSQRYLKVSIYSSLPSSNSMLLSSLSGTPWPLHLGHTKSLTPVTLRSPEHLLWHHILHVLHSIEFAPTPLPQHPHGNLPLR